MRIVLDKTRLQALLIIVPLLLVLVGGGYYYFLVRPKYGVSHESFLAPDTAVRAVVKPVLVQSYVSSLAHVGTRYVKGIPKVTSLQQFTFRTEWVHKMPFEFTFLLDQRSPEYLGVQLYVQEHPASESFADLVNDSGFFYALRPIRWDATRMIRQGKMQLLATGTLPVPGDVRDAVSTQFRDYVPFAPPPVSGRHFIEVVMDNRNGALMELQGALAQVVGLLGSRNLETALYRLWPSVLSVTLTVNLVEDDLLRFHLSGNCTDAAGAGNAVEALETAEGALHEFLARRYNFYFEGTARAVEGNRVEGVYDLSGFEAPLRRALGG